MNIKSFQQSPSGQLIQARLVQDSVDRSKQLGSKEVTYWAYVPNPLPPDLHFDKQLITALSNADRALGELAGLGRNLTNPQRLFRKMVIAYNSRYGNTNREKAQAIPD